MLQSDVRQAHQRDFLSNLNRRQVDLSTAHVAEVLMEPTHGDLYAYIELQSHG